MSVTLDMHSNGSYGNITAQQFDQKIPKSLRLEYIPNSFTIDVGGSAGADDAGEDNERSRVKMTI